MGQNNSTEIPITGNYRATSQVTVTLTNGPSLNENSIPSSVGVVGAGSTGSGMVVSGGSGGGGVGGMNNNNSSVNSSSVQYDELSRSLPHLAWSNKQQSDNNALKSRTVVEIRKRPPLPVFRIPCNNSVDNIVAECTGTMEVTRMHLGPVSMSSGNIANPTKGILKPPSNKRRPFRRPISHEISNETTATDIKQQQQQQQQNVMTTNNNHETSTVISNKTETIEIRIEKKVEDHNENISSSLAAKVCRNDSMALCLERNARRARRLAENPREDSDDCEEINEQTKVWLRLSEEEREQDERELQEIENAASAQVKLATVKKTLSRKLSRRPSIDVLKNLKIIRFSDLVYFFQADNYDRRGDKPWVRLTSEEKAQIRKELNEYKTKEMPVHARSTKNTRLHL